MRQYNEIRNTHVENDGPFIIVHLDGYKTMDDNEDGTLIARVIATMTDDDVHHVVLYADNSDRLDEGVQETLAETIAELPDYFD